MSRKLEVIGTPRSVKPVWLVDMTALLLGLIIGWIGALFLVHTQSMCDDLKAKVSPICLAATQEQGHAISSLADVIVF
jgi:hypothetical protein